LARGHFPEWRTISDAAPYLISPESFYDKSPDLGNDASQQSPLRNWICGPAANHPFVGFLYLLGATKLCGAID